MRCSKGTAFPCPLAGRGGVEGVCRKLVTCRELPDPTGWYLAHDEDDFFARVDRLMELGRDSLEIKRKILERFTESELYPYAKSYLDGVHNRFGAYWHNHFATIGLIGMNEACVNFLKRDIGSAPGQALAARVLEHQARKPSSHRTW